MIAVCICVLLVIALWHFFWESIFLPSFRLRMRFRLFALRDELRKIKIVNPAILDAAIFAEAERRINVSIQVLGFVDPFLIERFHKQLKADGSLAEKIGKRCLQFESQAPAQVLRLTDEAAKLGLLSAMANSGGWIIYALPIASAVALFKKLSIAFREIATAPPHEVDKIVSCEPQMLVD